jgi:hypothetical protein
MTHTSVRVRTVQDDCLAVGWAGYRTLTETQAISVGK